MSKVIILGSGAAPGVPSLAYGFGDCDPKEEKNIRLRSGTYMEISGVKLLIDTSPDLRMQLILSNIRDVDAVFYTHPHADHLHGIDDLREINRITGRAIELFASLDNLNVIRTRFPYLIAEKKEDVEAAAFGAQTQAADTSGLAGPSGSGTQAPDTKGAFADWRQPKDEQARIRKRKKDLKKTEDAIHRLETRDGEIDDLLTQEDVYTDTARLVELNNEKQAIAAKLETLYEQWEALAEEDSL